MLLLIPIAGPVTDVSESLSELFAASQSSQVELHGEPVFSLFELPEVPASMLISLERATTDPVQGLRIKARGAELEVNGRVASDFVLWWDAAPNPVQVRVLRATADASLRMWNVWRGGMDVTQAWLGNAGIRLEANEGNVRLRCSDGTGPVDFTDQVLCVVIDGVSADYEQRA